MPRNLQLMRTQPLRQIVHQPESAFLVEDPPAMSYRRCQSGVSVVTALEQIERFADDPLLNRHAREFFPGKRACLLGLIASIDLHGVVRGGAAQAGTFAAWANVFKCAGIDQ